MIVITMFLNGFDCKLIFFSLILRQISAIRGASEEELHRALGGSYYIRKAFTTLYFLALRNYCLQRYGQG